VPQSIIHKERENLSSVWIATRIRPVNGQIAIEL